MQDISKINRAINAISSQIGILYHIVKIPRLNNDPKLTSFGVWPSNTNYLNGEHFKGRSSGCGTNWEDAILSTIGETLERYAPSFYDESEGIKSSYNKLKKNAIHPSEFALFHDEQFKDKRFPISKFDEDTNLKWFSTYDLTNGKECWLPGQFIYMPYSKDDNYITVNTSTGLASHTNYYSAVLTALYEVIERDSFVITWLQNIVPPKIKITPEISSYIDSKFPTKYEWHFFDIKYDINIPTVFGFCIGETEFGKFIAVGSSSRATYGQALKKVILEIGQAIPYLRHTLGQKKGLQPNDDFNFIQDFEAHSIFYNLRPDLLHVFDNLRKNKETKVISINQNSNHNNKEQIIKIINNIKKLGYNILFKDITTPDIRQLGYYSIKVFIPQLIPLSGSYPFYFLGGKRIYSVPKKFGYVSNDFFNLNKFPHPFP